MLGSEEREYSVGSVVPVLCEFEDCVERELDRLVLISIVAFDPEATASERLGVGTEKEDRPLLEFDIVVVAVGLALIVTFSTPSLSSPSSLAAALAPNSSPIDLDRFFMYWRDSSLGRRDLSRADSVPEEYMDECVVADESRRDNGCKAEGRREDRLLSLLRKLIASSTSSSSRSSNTAGVERLGEEGIEGEETLGGRGLENPVLSRLDFLGR